MASHLRPALYLVLCVFTVLLSACERNAALVIHGETMGTTYSVQITAPPEQLDGEKLRQEIEARLQTINQIMSTYDADSSISQFNQSSEQGWHRTDPALVALVARSIALANLTGGAFDISVGPLVNLWGFGKDPVVISPPAQAKIHKLLQSVGIQNIRADEKTSSIWKKNKSVMLDLSAIAKGYAVDQMAEILRSHHIENFMAEIGGEIYAQGLAPHGDFWHVGIESPDQSSGRGKITTILKLENMAIATSGDYRNYFLFEGKRYSHTIDPTTGMPVNSDLASVTVLYPDAETADALATAMMVMGARRSREFADEQEIPVVLLTRTGEDYSIDTNIWAEKYLSRKN